MYDKLKKELEEKGYSTEEIKLILDKYHFVETFESPMGTDRQDLGVKAHDVDGHEKRISSIMLGYNDEKIVLPNGELVQLDELQEALIQSLTLTDEDKVFICKKTGKIVSVDDIVAAVIEKTKEAGAIIYSESDTNLNQEIRTVEIRGAGKQGTKKAGLAMLGNGKIELPCGEYVSIDEMIKALNEYVIATPIIPIPPVQPVQPEKPEDSIKPKEEKYFVTVRRKAIIPILGVVLSIITSITSFGIEIDEQKVLDFLVNVIGTEQVVETEEDVNKRVFGEFVVGEKEYMSEGVPYYESSDHAYGGKNNSGVFGSQIRGSGDYELDRVSILYNGKIEEVSVEKGKDLYSILEETSKKLGVGIEDLEVSLHFGNAVSGWVDIKDLIDDTEYIPKVVSEKQIVLETYEGTQDFNGRLNFVTKEGKTVELSVLDENGDEVNNGSIVRGSDGRYYEISKLNIRNIKGEKKLVFNAQDYIMKLSASILLTALATYLAKKKKEQIEEEAIISEAGDDGHDRITYAPRSKQRSASDKIIYNINGGEEILPGERLFGQKVETTEEIYNAVMEAKKRYEKVSLGKRIMEKLKGIQPDWYVILQRLNEGSLTLEEVNNMYREDNNEGRKII